MEVSGKLALLMATVLSLAAAPAMAQDNNSDQAPAPGHGPMFQQAKAKILQNLRDREACVQAANDFEDLLGCKPGQRGGQNAGPASGGDGGNDSDQ